MGWINVIFSLFLFLFFIYDVAMTYFAAQSGKWEKGVSMLFLLFSFFKKRGGNRLSFNANANQSLRRVGCLTVPTAVLPNAFAS